MSMILPGWAKWAALGLLAVVLYAFGRLDGARIEGAKHADYVAQQASQAVRIIQAQQRVSADVQVEFVERIKVIREKGDEIIREVPVYITAADDAGCTVPVGFVRSHRAATTGEPAGGPGDSDREASGITLSAVAELDADNYRQCRIWREQVIGWQEFYERLQTARHTP